MQVFSGLAAIYTFLYFPLFCLFLLLFCYYFVTQKFGSLKIYA